VQNKPENATETTSVYNKDANTVEYTNFSKYPAVKLLPNTERKRILGECPGVWRRAWADG
jgi:hypothetical protein